MYVLLSHIRDVCVLICGTVEKQWRVRASLPGTLVGAHWEEKFCLSTHGLTLTSATFSHATCLLKEDAFFFQSEKKKNTKEQDDLLLLRALISSVGGRKGGVESNTEILKHYPFC